MKNRLLYTLLTGSLLMAPALARPDGNYYSVVHDTAQMVQDSTSQQMAHDHGLQILNLTWEDTGRYEGSSVGPNISDVTLQVKTTNPQTQHDELVCLPVIRFPNFSDKTADLQLEHFYVLVGNEKGQDLHKVNLREYLGNFREYMSHSKSWKGPQTSLLAKRDSHALVSAQACFLPIPKEGEATFNPVLFNYQSSKGDPAVLSIVATREGTSATIIDNNRDGFGIGGTWGQRLFFNHEGERASFTGKRLSDFNRERQPTANTTTGPSAAKQEGMNMVLLIQVPLKQKPRARRAVMYECNAPCPSAGAADMATRRRGSDVEAAVVGHGKDEGPYTEVDNLAIERDPNFPVRVTVQFYRATSNGIVSERDLAGVASQINQVYADGDYVGSLVTGKGDADRPTQYTGDKHQPAGWWDDFWKRYEKNQPKSEPASQTQPKGLFAQIWSYLFNG